MTLAGTASGALLLLLLGGAGGSVPPRNGDGFDHEKHRKVFPECEGCHAGVTDPARPRYPAPAACATCHDGVVQKVVRWTAPPDRPSNLRFTHPDHARKSGAQLPGDSSLACQQCHVPAGAAPMTVRRTLSTQCLDCHGIRAAHLSAPDTACATCHLTLAAATALPEARVAAFGRPASHDESGFVSAAGHGRRAEGGERTCAVCHARDFCAQCHVNAPEVRAIQALAPDRRSLAIRAELEPPDSHREGRFLSRHGGTADRDPARCASCHTRESCMACHRTRPPVVLALPDSGAGRAIGARIVRSPGYHGVGFADRHGPPAGAAPGSCTACHARAECLECHRPNPGAAGNYHPAGFIVRHAAAAYNRQVECAECHNQGAICATCHEQAGLATPGWRQPVYHDANPAFSLNHGVAARQNLESCVSCHTERDCLTCHSAQGGRGFNPHGPGFDPERVRRRNPQMCSACHGRSIPGR